MDQERALNRIRSAWLIASVCALAPLASLAQRPPTRPPPPPPARPPLDTARRDVIAAPPRRVGFGTIDGLVTDTTLVPIASASVTVLSSSVRVETGPNGRFRLLRVPAGQYLLIVRRLGYHPTSGVVEVAADDTLRLSYALEQLPQTLEAVVVTEERRSFRMMEFEYRRKLGFGEFMTREQIEKHNSVYVADLLRLFTSVGVVDVSGGGGQYDQYAVSKRGRTTLAASGSCTMSVLVDGVPMPSPFSLSLLPSPRDLAGIEVFAGPATTPMEYALYDRGCGLILVWTKDGA